MSECEKRVMRGWPAMCEGLDRREIDMAIHGGFVQELVWWLDVQPDDTTDDLFKEVLD